MNQLGTANADLVDNCLGFGCLCWLALNSDKGKIEGLFLIEKLIFNIKLLAFQKVNKEVLGIVVLR